MNVTGVFLQTVAGSRIALICRANVKSTCVPSRGRAENGTSLRAGGKSPQWSDDGTTIYYLTLDWKLTEIPLKTGAEVHVGTPRSLFSLSRDSEFEVHSKDKFLVNEQVGKLFGRQTVMLNWDAALGLTK